METIKFFEENGYMRDMEETLRSISEGRDSVALHSANQIKHLKSLLGGDVSEWLKDGETVVDRLKREREDLGKTILWCANLKKQNEILINTLKNENISIPAM